MPASVSVSTSTDRSDPRTNNPVDQHDDGGHVTTEEADPGQREADDEVNEEFDRWQSMLANIDAHK